MPRPPVIPIETLRSEIEAGRSLSEIARRHRVSRRAVQKRVRKMEQAGALVAVVHPQCSTETVDQQQTVVEVFCRMVATKYEMLQAYLSQFRDENGRLCMAPTAQQYEVRWWEVTTDAKGTTRRKLRTEPLSQVMSRAGENIEIESVTYRGCDSRVEARHLSTELADMMLDGQELKNMVNGTLEVVAWRDALVEHLQTVDPLIREKLLEIVRKHMLRILLPSQPAHDQNSA